MYKRHLLQIAILVFAFILIGFSAWAVPGIINYQGRLTDPDGVSMDGYYIMEFYLYNEESDGSHLWTEQQNVAVTNGVYSVELGKITSFPLDLFDNEIIYLEIKVFSTSTGWETLSPRQRLTSTPFAMKSGYASTAGDADTLDGLHTSDLFNTGDDFGRSGVASDLYEGTNTLTEKYVNEAQAGSITNGMIVNNAVTSNKIADGAVSTSDLSGNAVTSAKIQDGTIQQSDLSFSVPDGHSLDAADGDPVDAVYVDDNGKVGIGTTSPEYKLHIDGGLSNGNVGLNRADTTYEASIRFFTDGSAKWLIGLDNEVLHDDGFRIWDYSQKNYAFYIKEGGNVGIGTTDPKAKLEVDGDVKLGSGGNLYASGALGSFKIIRGNVNANGTISTGEGFNISKIARGSYKVTFINEFSSLPSVVITAGDPAINDDNIANANFVQTTGFQVDIWDGGVGSNISEDSWFSFIAIGPR